MPSTPWTRGNAGPSRPWLCPGFGVALEWLWGRIGVALEWPWGGFGVALGCLSVGYQHALKALCGRIEVAFAASARIFCVLPSGSYMQRYLRCMACIRRV